MDAFIIEIENFSSSLAENLYCNALVLTHKGRLESLFLYDAAADLLEEERIREPWGSAGRRLILNQVLVCYQVLSFESMIAPPTILPSLWSPYYYFDRILDLDLELRNSKDSSEKESGS